MKIYPDSTPRFASQLALDLLFVAWVIAWIWVGTIVHDAVTVLAEPGDRLAASATDLAESMSAAGSALDDVPVVGSGVSEPFDQAADASSAIAGAGEAEARAADRLAFWLGVTVAVLPILYVGGRFVPRRVRLVREASAGQRFLDSEADLEIFALRAINNQPLHRLAGVSDDPVGALRRGDAPVVAALAQLELARTGLVARTTPQGRLA